MGIATCERCDAPIDTDEDAECYLPNDECVCARCREIQWERDNEGFIND